MPDKANVQTDAPAEDTRDKPSPRPKVPELDRFRMQSDFNLYGTREKKVAQARSTKRQRGGAAVGLASRYIPHFFARLAAAPADVKPLRPKFVAAARRLWNFPVEPVRDHAGGCNVALGGFGEQRTGHAAQGLVVIACSGDLHAQRVGE